MFLCEERGALSFVTLWLDMTGSGAGVLKDGVLDTVDIVKESLL